MKRRCALSASARRSRTNVTAAWAGGRSRCTRLSEPKMLETIRLEVVGEQRLVCESCELRVKRLLKDLRGLREVNANARTQRIDLRIDPAELDRSIITERLTAAGYETRQVDGAAGNA